MTSDTGKFFALREANDPKGAYVSGFRTSIHGDLFPRWTGDRYRAKAWRTREAAERNRHNSLQPWKLDVVEIWR